MKKILIIFLFLPVLAMGQDNYKTYCNPLDLDYTYMVYNSHQDLSYRSGADPAVVEFRDEYYMFVTRSMGYWHSKDLTNWEFITPEKWYFEGSNAPAAHNYKDSILYVMGNPSGSMSPIYTDSPRKGDWKAVPGILNNLQDPALFIDDDQAYLYWGSSNLHPIRGKKLDMKNRFIPGEEKELFNLIEEEHGWERFGENHSDTLEGYVEGAWMTKAKDKYYLQYGAPGTEFNVYGDGAYVGSNPLGPFEYMPNNPFSYKPGGFMNGAGHGSTVEGPGDSWWHFATMAISVNVNWERRIGMFRTHFDEDGLMYSNTYFGDYPHWAPTEHEMAGEFTGWMLLSYNKPVRASSSEGEYTASNVTDENVKSFWLASDKSENQWLEIDLQELGNIYALQVNYHDHASDLYGRLPDLYHQYSIQVSLDGKTWKTIVDKRESREDVPNDYVELKDPVKARYFRFNNTHVPTPNLALSAVRVFGKGGGKLPVTVKNFKVDRQPDRRDVMLSWKEVPMAQGYNVLWGIAPDKLYSSWLVYSDNHLELKSLGRDQEYYFSVEAFNENGISKRTEIIKVE